ncbi:hypothetical protein ACIGH6_17105 [Brachybacterium paraconglomeratum]|uniref:hypothetical protein n=1 Tax=Brachybacterium paraconglomeratum TaxID=173362 RepID=UPI0037C4F846
MSTTNTTEKTPVAVLGGLRDEGLDPTPTKEQDMHNSTVPTRIQLDEFASVDVDPRDEGVEVTFSTGNEFGQTRSTYGIALVPEEARRLAAALLDGVAPNFCTADPEEIQEHVEVARRFQPPAMTPAKAAALMKAGAL